MQSSVGCSDLRCGGASIVPDFDAGEAGHAVLDDPWVTVQDWEDPLNKRHDRIDKAVRARIIVMMAGAEAEEIIVGKCAVGDGDDRYEIKSLAASSYSGLSADKWTRFEPRMRRQTRRHRPADILTRSSAWRRRSLNAARWKPKRSTTF